MVVVVVWAVSVGVGRVEVVDWALGVAGGIIVEVVVF
jgi:hypothetical protein